jgi:hypothetical protein
MRYDNPRIPRPARHLHRRGLARRRSPRTNLCALQSVYTAGQSKADLLHLVTDLAVAGDSQEVMLADRPEYAAVAAEPDPARQIGMFASLTAATMERLAPSGSPTARPPPPTRRPPPISLPPIADATRPSEP